MPSPVSSVLLRIPNDDLPKLRDYFLAQDGGLTITQFIAVFVKLMGIQTLTELREVLPELLFFFDLVDLNADGGMDFSEFVMFVIDEVAEQKIAPIMEKLQLVTKRHIQNPSHAVYIRCCKRIPEVKAVVVAAGGEFHIYLEDPESPALLKSACKYLLRSRLPRGRREPSSATSGGGTETKAPEVVDVAFVPSRDTFLVLRSDLCIEFVKVQSRSNIHQDTVEHVGFFAIPHIYARLAVWECFDDHGDLLQSLVFAAGAKKGVDVLSLRSETSRSFELTPHTVIEGHTDIVRDVVVVAKEPFVLFATGGMDGRVIVWDLHSLKSKGRRRGQRAGVECLSYDGVATLLAGGYDNSVVGWNLHAETDTPVFILEGHGSPVIGVTGMLTGDRAVSLDADGLLILWDTTVRDTGKIGNRKILTFETVDDHLRSVTAAYKSGPQGDESFVVCHGKQQGLYKVTPAAYKQAAVVASMYSARLQMVVVVYTNEIVLWDAETGEVSKRIEDIVQEGANEITAACLDDRQRKAVTGDSSGVVSVYNCATAMHLKTYPPIPSSVLHVCYTHDKTIIVVGSNGVIYVFDDRQTDVQNDYLLRDTRTHDADVVAMAYSYPLGLIATADSEDTVMIWDYQFLSVEAIVENCTGAAIGRLAFVEEFSLLVVTDAHGRFTLVPVGITEKTLGRQTRSVVPVLEPRSTPKKSRFFDEEEEDDDEEEDGKEGDNKGAGGGGGGGEASSTGKAKKSGQTGTKTTEAPPVVVDALAAAEEDGAEAAAGAEGEAGEGGSGKGAAGRSAPPALAKAPRPLMVTRSLSAYIHVSRGDDSDDSNSDSDSDGDNGTRRGPWSRKATKKYILSTLKDGGRAVRAIAVHVEEDQSLTHNAAADAAFECSVTDAVAALAAFTDALNAGDDVDENDRREANWKVLSDEIHDHFDWHDHEQELLSLSLSLPGGTGTDLQAASLQADKSPTAAAATAAAAAATGLRGRSRPGTPGTPDSSRPSTGGGSAGGRRSLFRKKSRARRGGIVSRFPTITVVCGSDDGALCVYDFTAAVADLLQGLDHHSWHMDVPHGDDYNPYRHGLGKFVRKFEYARALWPPPTAPKDPSPDVYSPPGTARARAPFSPPGSPTRGVPGADRTPSRSSLKRPVSVPVPVAADVVTVHPADPAAGAGVAVGAGAGAGAGATVRFGGADELGENEGRRTPVRSRVQSPLLMGVPRSFLVGAEDGALPCTLRSVFGDRTGALVGAEFVGDDFDILTCAALTTVQLWTTQGHMKAVLTRGKRWDKVFPPFWHAPIPNADKGELLRKKVDLLIRALHLDDLVARNRDAANADRERRAAARTMSVPGGGATVAHALAALLVDPSDAAHRRAAAAPAPSAAAHLPAGPPGSASAGLAVLERRAEAMARADEAKAAARAAKLAASRGGGTMSSRPSGMLAAEGSHTTLGVGVGVGVGVGTHSSSSHGGVSSGVESLAASKPYLKMPDRERVLRQTLYGEVTYALSAKDYAALKLEEERQLKEAAAAGKAARQAGRGKRRGLRGAKAKAATQKTADEEEFMAEIQHYMREREEKTLGQARGGGAIRDPSLKATAMKSQYAYELAQIEANDPNNWEIQSTNRQRELYHHLYTELDHKGVAVGAQAVVQSKITRVMRDTPGGLPAYTDRLAATADADRARAERRQQLLNAVVPAAPQFMDPMFVEARKQAYAQARAAAEARAQRRAERRARGPVEAPPPPVDPAFSFDFSFDAEAPAEAEKGEDVPVDGVDAGADAEGADVDMGDAVGKGGEVDAGRDDAPEPSLTAPVEAPPFHPPPATAAVVKAPAPAPAPAPVPAVMTSTTYASRSASLQTPPAAPAAPRRTLQPALSAPSFATATTTTTGSAAHVHAQGGAYPGAYERFRLTRPSSLLREGERYAAGSEIYKALLGDRQVGSYSQDSYATGTGAGAGDGGAASDGHGVLMEGTGEGHGWALRPHVAVQTSIPPDTHYQSGSWRRKLAEERQREDGHAFLDDAVGRFEARLGLAETALRRAEQVARAQRRAKKKLRPGKRLPGLAGAPEPSAVRVLLAQVATNSDGGAGEVGGERDSQGLSPLLRDAAYLRRQQAAAEASRARKLAYAVDEGLLMGNRPNGSVLGDTSDEAALKQARRRFARDDTF